MAKQALSVNVQNDLRVLSPTANAGQQPATSPAPIMRRRPTTRPGDRLRRAVEAALAELAATAGADDPTRHRLDDVLVGGLAWAAATGDTCRIEPAVHNVRTARARLRAADPDGARTALLAARDGLGRPLPSQRDSR